MRCEAVCQIPPTGITKRCIRDADHPVSELHVWIEALNRVGGLPQIVEWREPIASTPFIIGEIVVVHHG